MQGQWALGKVLWSRGATLQHQESWGPQLPGSACTWVHDSLQWWWRLKGSFHGVRKSSSKVKSTVAGTRKPRKLILWGGVRGLQQGLGEERGAISVVPAVQRCCSPAQLPPLLALSALLSLVCPFPASTGEWCQTTRSGLAWSGLPQKVPGTHLAPSACQKPKVPSGNPLMSHGIRAGVSLP